MQTPHSEASAAQWVRPRTFMLWGHSAKHCTTVPLAAARFLNDLYLEGYFTLVTHIQGWSTGVAWKMQKKVLNNLIQTFGKDRSSKQILAPWNKKETDSLATEYLKFNEKKTYAVCHLGALPSKYWYMWLFIVYIYATPSHFTYHILTLKAWEENWRSSIYWRGPWDME